ncbi:hypothetical protein SAMD00019534_073790 [Acytostelium subglobosum LB1]|uniref:hypothetical protein n=1 Tax=Acytostelium subglobosum LB1 TaxID=1410327 RepID=UPI000644E714|nr:hypothetical protein SAMD00019534_073790 [Acytostelium subglobosum LB1]GAM24204.1 hypothetical protein SAMD00019534_073790 [Acytostelium subglobosum LB1]|eukprot:XP_012752530.1 hypothetical protein SAMD00019534_073790 [Acytostelium subglobosum LB1]
MIVTVELHQIMLDIAEKYANFRRDYNCLVHIGDGLEYIKRLNDDEKFDLIIQDGCASTPCDLLTLDSLKTMSNLLSPHGIYIQNLINMSKHRGVVRNLQDSFKELYYVESKSVNQVLVGYNHDKVFNVDELTVRGEQFQSQENPQFDLVNEYSSQFKRLTNVMINCENYKE